MRDSWVGLQAGVDARRWAGLLRRAHDVALRDGHVPRIVRGVIAESWERCTQTGLDPAQRETPLAVAPDDAAEAFREHPLADATDVLHDVLGDLLPEAQHIVVVSDADGCLLWSDGDPGVLAAAESIGFCPGRVWSEGAAGTNAVGTALAADHAVQVFSAEHYRLSVHDWQCSGAPIHDPETGDALGAVDVTGRWNTASPHTLALVGMAARLIEERLRARMLQRDARILALFAERAGAHPHPAAALSPSGRVLAATGGWGPELRGGRLTAPAEGIMALADGSEVAVSPLGEGRLVLAGAGGEPRRGNGSARLNLRGQRGVFTTAAGARRLTERHTEIAQLLASHPDGLSARALSEALHGAGGHEIAVRTEMHRLRETLGAALATRPYRLRGVVVETSDDRPRVAVVTEDDGPRAAAAPG